MKKEQLAEVLRTVCYGRKNAMSAEHLISATHTSATVLRNQINRLRCEGVPIASGSEGYFYAATAGEIYATIRDLKKMQAGIDRAVCGLESALDAFGKRDTP